MRGAKFTAFRLAFYVGIFALNCEHIFTNMSHVFTPVFFAAEQLYVIGTQYFTVLLVWECCVLTVV